MHQLRESLPTEKAGRKVKSTQNKNVARETEKLQSDLRRCREGNGDILNTDACLEKCLDCFQSIISC
jgi:hypothetical protein